MPILQLLGFLGRQGRFVLLAGLVLALALPGFAHTIKEWLPELVALLLFLSALRIGPVDAVGNLSNISNDVLIVFILQLGLPCCLAIFFSLNDISTPNATALILMLAASSIAGSPSLVILAGSNPAPALRLLVLGTVLLPVTIVPVFWIYQPIDGLVNVFETSLKLIVLISSASLLAFIIRHYWLKFPSKPILLAMDGLAVLLMALLVIGLMSALGPGLYNNLLATSLTMVLAFCANFGLQCLTYFISGRNIERDVRISRSIVAGNRNMALFLVALPASVMEPLLLFIGCYQIPMYLTPVFMAPIYRGRNSKNQINSDHT